MSNSSDYTNHHYVPQFYLENFSFEVEKSGKKIYAFDKENLSKDLPDKLQYYSPKKICSSKHFYRMKDTHFKSSLGIEDDNIIEKQAFLQYENYLGKYIKELEIIDPNKEFSVITPFDKARFFIRGILSLKKRNPSVIKSPDIQKGLKQFFNNRIAEIDNKLKEELNPQDKQDWENMKISYSDPETIGSDFLNLALLLEDFDEGWIESAELMLLRPWHLYITTENKPFITSDNPGVFINKKDGLMYIYNMHFSEGVQFFFPLSPTQCLGVRLDKPNPPLTLKKQILIQHTYDWAVDEINSCALENANKYIYGNSEKALIETAAYVKSRSA